MSSLRTAKRTHSCQPTTAERREVADVHEGQPERLGRTVGELPREFAAVPDRREPADPLQVDRQLGERKERAAEQREGQDDEPLHDRELTLVFGDRRRVGGDEREREAAQQSHHDRHPDPRARHATEQHDDAEVDADGDEAPDADVEERAVDDLPPGQRCGVHADEDRVPLEAEQDAEGELLAGHGDGGHHEQRRRHELQVADAVDARRTGVAGDEGREPDAEGEQVQQRRAERHREHRPHVRADGAQPVLGDVPGAEAARPFGERGAIEGVGMKGDSHSINDRPVSRRNTSSSDDRRTRLVIGSSPRFVTSTSAASPFCA